MIRGREGLSNTGIRNNKKGSRRGEQMGTGVNSCYTSKVLVDSPAWTLNNEYVIRLQLAWNVYTTWKNIDNSEVASRKHIFIGENCKSSEAGSKGKRAFVGRFESLVSMFRVLEYTLILMVKPTVHTLNITGRRFDVVMQETHDRIKKMGARFDCISKRVAFCVKA